MNTPPQSVYEIVTEFPVTNDEYIKLFKAKDIRDIFIRYLSEKKLNAILERWQAKTEESEYRRWAIDMIDKVILDMFKIEEWIKNKIRTRIKKNKEKAEENK